MKGYAAIGYTDHDRLIVRLMIMIDWLRIMIKKKCDDHDYDLGHRSIINQLV